MRVYLHPAAQDPECAEADQGGAAADEEIAKNPHKAPVADDLFIPPGGRFHGYSPAVSDTI